MERRVKSFRGISERLAIHYLENLGGEQIDESVVEDADSEWRAELSAETVSVGPSLSLTEVTVAFEGTASALDPLIEQFSRKAMRAGG